MMSIQDRLFNAGGRLPRPIAQAIKYLYYRATMRRRERGWLILNSIPKSGTNFVRLFLANYFRLVYEGADSRTDYETMHNVLFPNERGRYLRRGTLEPPHDIMRNTPFSDFLYCHQTTFFEFFEGKLIFLYRNPLDFIISSYFYRWKNRPGKQDWYDHPRDAVDRLLGDYIEKYGFMRGWARKKDNFLCVSYEMLMRSPFDVFSMMVIWLGLPLDVGRLKRAIEYADIKAVRDLDEAAGAIHSPDGFKGYFTRSGKIGQWKEYFDDGEVQSIWDRLEANGIHRSEFVVE